MKNLIKAKKGEKSKVRFVKKQLTSENSNWMELFQGPSGSGKTWSAISQAIEIDPDFDVSKQLVFDFRNLMQLINTDLFKTKKWKIIIFDEPQTNISNRAWQSLTNKLMNYLITTFRHQNICVMFCCPYRDFLDSASMKMIHCITEMVKIDKKKGKVQTRPKLQQYNSKLKKTYEHSIYVAIGGSAVPLRFDYISKPPKDAIRIYEKMKTDFTSKLNQEIESKLDKLANKKEEPEEIEDEYAGKKPLSPVQFLVHQCWKEGIFKQALIAEELNKRRTTISACEKAMRKKGYNKEIYRERHDKIQD